MSERTCSITISVGIDFGHTSTQAVHKKQDSKISFAFLSKSNLPFLYAPSKSKKPRGEVTSSGFIICIVQTGIHFPHFTQSSAVSLKLKISSNLLIFTPSLKMFFYLHYASPCMHQMPSQYYE